MNRLIPALVVALPALCAAAGSADGWKPFAATLAPGKIHEECQRIGKGDQRRYQWKADGPVDFNIHYHEHTEVFYPVKRDGMRGDGGTFRAKIAQDYCWMWTARNATAKIEGRIETR